MDLRGDRRVTDVLMVDISRLYRVELANIAPSSISGHDVMSGTLVVIDDILYRDRRANWPSVSGSSYANPLSIGEVQ